MPPLALRCVLLCSIGLRSVALRFVALRCVALRCVCVCVCVCVCICSAPARRAPCRVIWGFSGWSAISVFPRAPARSGSVAVTGISPCFAGFREWRLLRTAGVLRLSCRASLHFSLFVACMLDCSSARLKPGQPSFSGGFRVFWIATRKCVCVCRCVCVAVRLCVPVCGCVHKCA